MNTYQLKLNIIVMQRKDNSNKIKTNIRIILRMRSSEDLVQYMLDGMNLYSNIEIKNRDTR